MFTAKLKSVKLMPMRTVEIALEVPWSHEVPIRLPERIFALVEGREVSAATCYCDRGEWDVRLDREDEAGSGIDLAHVKVCKVALKDDEGAVVARVTLAAEVNGSDLEWLHGRIGGQAEVGMVQRQEELSINVAAMEPIKPVFSSDIEKLAALPTMQRRGKTL
jgi:hypothetical protein